MRVSHAVLKGTCSGDCTSPSRSRNTPPQHQVPVHARFRLHSRHKHARTHCRACQNTTRAFSLPPRALESRVAAPCSPDAPLPHSHSRPREHACCPHARPPARAPASALTPPPRAHSLGRGSTVVTLGPSGAQPPVPGSPPRPAPPESLHSTRRRWNDALGSGYRGLPATARVRCHGQWRGAAVSSPGPAPPPVPRGPIEARYVTRSRAEAGVGRGAARRADCAGTAPSLAASRWTASGRAWRASRARGAAWGPSRRPVLAAAPSASSLDALAGRASPGATGRRGSMFPSAPSCAAPSGGPGSPFPGALRPRRLQCRERGRGFCAGLGGARRAVTVTLHPLGVPISVVRVRSP